MSYGSFVPKEKIEEKAPKTRRKGRKKASKAKFIKNFCENGGDAAQAARDANYTYGFIGKKLHTLLEDPEVQREIRQKFSKEGLKEDKYVLYQTLREGLKAMTAPAMAVGQSKLMVEQTNNILDSSMSLEKKEFALGEVQKCFPQPRPNFQIRNWSADMCLRILGEFAPLKQEHSFSDPLEGKTDEEQDAVLKEAEEVLRRAQGG